MVSTFDCRSEKGRNWITFSARAPWTHGRQNMSSTDRNQIPGFVTPAAFLTASHIVNYRLREALAPLNATRPETWAPDGRLFQLPLSVVFPWLQKPAISCGAALKRILRTSGGGRTYDGGNAGNEIQQRLSSVVGRARRERELRRLRRRDRSYSGLGFLPSW
jgi:hypothetical protein